MAKCIADPDKVYDKYMILDAKTGIEKDGRYFVLKIDSDDPIESIAVKLALKAYADYQSTFGRAEYAQAVMRYIRGDA